MALNYIFLLLMTVVFSPTEENPLLVVQKQSECVTPSPKQCVKAAIIRGETSIGLPSICYNKVDPGPCGRDLIRVYYDWKSNRCKHFSFSGCGGNANRFISIKNCYHICNHGYRTRKMGTTPPPPPPINLTVDAVAAPVAVKCELPKPKRKVKLNVTQVHEIEVEM